jgi:hypothetical protein
MIAAVAHSARYPMKTVGLTPRRVAGRRALAKRRSSSTRAWTGRAWTKRSPTSSFTCRCSGASGPLEKVKP